MQIHQKDKTTLPQWSTSTIRRRERRRKKLMKKRELLAISSGLLVVCVLSAYQWDSQITVEERESKEVLTTSQTPFSISAEDEERVLPTAQPIPEKGTYTDDELYCMAVAIYNEAGGNICTDEHRELVGYVILNRVNDPRFPNTIRGVLEAPGQYAGLGVRGIHFAKRASNKSEASAVSRAWETARKVLENRDNIPIPSNVLFQAQFVQGVGTYKKIGNTYFCYAREVK